MGIQVNITDTYSITLKELLQLAPNSKAAKEVEATSAEIQLLQKIVADASDWAITELPSRIEPRWLADARKYLGTN
jgi:hypothetical protein